MHTLVPTNVVLSPDYSGVCPDIKLDVVYDDVKPIANDIFVFDSNEFSINTSDTNYTGVYRLKVIATFKHTYIQIAEFPFKVVLIFYCENSNVTNPG